VAVSLAHGVVPRIADLDANFRFGRPLGDFADDETRASAQEMLVLACLDFENEYELPRHVLVETVAGKNVHRTVVPPRAFVEWALRSNDLCAHLTPKRKETADTPAQAVEQHEEAVPRRGRPAVRALAEYFASAPVSPLGVAAPAPVDLRVKGRPIRSVRGRPK
jgi:hypothetical protein